MLALLQHPFAAQMPGTAGAHHSFGVSICHDVEYLSDLKILQALQGFLKVMVFARCKMPRKAFYIRLFIPSLG